MLKRFAAIAPMASLLMAQASLASRNAPPPPAPPLQTAPHPPRLSGPPPASVPALPRPARAPENPVVLTDSPRIGSVCGVTVRGIGRRSRCVTGWYWPAYIGTTYAPYWYDTAYGPPLAEIPRRVDSIEPPQAPDSPAAAPVDEGREALRRGRYDEAINVYAARVEEQRQSETGSDGSPLIDRTDLRLMGLALAGAGRFDEAAAAWMQAELEEPGITARPLNGPQLIGSRAELRRIVVRAVRHAHARPSTGAWEAVAVLMEAEGRSSLAAGMRERARAAGVTRESPPRQRATPGPASFTMPPIESR